MAKSAKKKEGYFRAKELTCKCGCNAVGITGWCRVVRAENYRLSPQLSDIAVGIPTVAQWHDGRP